MSGLKIKQNSYLNKLDRQNQAVFIHPTNYIPFFYFCSSSSSTQIVWLISKWQYFCCLSTNTFVNCERTEKKSYKHLNTRLYSNHTNRIFSRPFPHYRWWIFFYVFLNLIKLLLVCLRVHTLHDFDMFIFIFSKHVMIATTFSSNRKCFWFFSLYLYIFVIFASPFCSFDVKHRNCWINVGDINA